MTAAPRFRTARPTDAEAVAALHAASWRRHYRGAFSDTFLDGDLLTDRRTVWTSRLTTPGHHTTILAEHDTALAGFIHLIYDHDPHYGAFIDNLHVTPTHHRTGIGTALLTKAAEATTTNATTNAMYLWVLTQNTRAQHFYRATGGTRTETATVEPPGGIPTRLHGIPTRLHGIPTRLHGIPTRLHGTPTKERYTWPDATTSLRS